MQKTSNIHVLHISTALSYRGGEQQILLLAKELRHNNVQQDFLLPQKSELSEKLILAGFTVTHYQKRGSISIKASQILVKQVHLLQASIIHTHDSHAHNIYWLANILYRLNIPCIHAKRNAFPMSTNLLSKLKYNSKSIDQVICISNASKQSTTHTIKDSSKIQIIPDGIDFTTIHTQKLDLNYLFQLKEDTIVIANVGALSKEKDQSTFIKCAKYLTTNYPSLDFRFLIAGTGVEENALRNEIKVSNLSNRIYLLGYVDDIIALLNSTQILIHTATSEGLGTILLQALATQTPIISTKSGGNEDIILNNETGILTEPGDFKTLSLSVIKLMQDPNLKKKLITNGIKFVEQFSIQTTTKKTLAIYKNITNKP